MQIIPPAITNLDMQIAEVRAMVEALIFLQEEGESARVRDASVAMLYVINEKLGTADSAVAALHRSFPGNAA